MTDASLHGAGPEGASSGLYLDDFAAGQIYTAGPISVTADAIKAYAHQYDPQPFHTDEASARATFFRGLVASGWHTASLTMSLVVQALPIAGGVIGGGVDELRWPTPLRPGDELRLKGEIMEVRPSRTKPGQGLVRVRTATLNREGQAVQTMIANLVVPRRPTADA
jgi:acyl dehydratase